MSGWAIVSKSVPGADEQGYMVFPAIVGPIKTDPIYEPGEVWGTPGVGFWGVEPDTLKGVAVSFLAGPDQNSDIYIAVLARGMAQVIESLPELRRELLACLSEGPQGLA